MQQNQLILFISLLFFSSSTVAQQQYSGEAVFDCETRPAAPSTTYLYVCNGETSCRSFLIFRARPDFSSVSAIALLFSSDPLELAQINNVPNSHIFPLTKEVIIPVNCSCSGEYYGANTTYVLSDGDDYFNITSRVYEGLSSCSSVLSVNTYDPDNLMAGMRVLVPLRCACPTIEQASKGVKFLLTYSIVEHDSIRDLSLRFNTSIQETVSANGFSEEGPLIYFTTTVLIPLHGEPLSSQTTIHHPVVDPPHRFIGLTATATTTKRRSKRGTRIDISVACAVVAVFVLCVTSALIALWRRRRKSERIEGKGRSVLQEHVLDVIRNADQALKLYGFDELNAATKEFSSGCRVKGSVYRGVVRGTVLAIKEMSREVTMEANILQKLNHLNLIGLRGVSVSKERCFLVYEYMENGSLKDWLHDQNLSEPLSWTRRVQITLDVANGLNYLHNFTDPPFVHKNIDSSNILLDGNVRAKIANFSLARSSEVGPVFTGRVQGTIGYMAPEYSESGMVTTKLDVFAFGVVMAELITRKDAVIKLEGGEETMLSAEMVSITKGEDAESKLRDFVDVGHQGGQCCPMSLVLPMAKLSVACLSQDPASRPSMDDVITILSSIQSDAQCQEAGYC